MKEFHPISYKHSNKLMENLLLGESYNTFPYMINASVYLVDHLIMPETDNMPT